MTRVLGITILAAACTVALLAAQDDPAKKDKAAPEKKLDPAEQKAEDKALPEKKELPPPSGEKPEEIIKRLNENFEKSEERLGKKDPREETQKVQDQIIKDLDELIRNQQNNPNC
jgi:hypothetical protein